MKNRLFTALEDGVVAFIGDFNDEALLRQDYPAPQFTLVLDRHLPFPERARDYREERRMAYPSIGDQLDALWKYVAEGTPPTDMQVRIQAVKDSIPKA